MIFPYLFIWIFVQGYVNGDVNFSDMSRDVKQMHQTISGMSQVVFDLSSKVQKLEGSLLEIKNKNSARGDSKQVSIDEGLKKREILAEKVEKMLAVQNNEKIEKAKFEIERKMQKNFVKMLSFLVISHPEALKTESDNVFKMMGAALNGNFDFNPLVQKLPKLLRNGEKNDFALVADALRESENYSSNARILGGIQNMDKILDIFGTIDIKEVSSFLNQIPMLFESVNGLVDGVEEYF